MKSFLKYTGDEQDLKIKKEVEEKEVEKEVVSLANATRRVASLSPN